MTKPETNLARQQHPSFSSGRPSTFRVMDEAFPWKRLHVQIGGIIFAPSPEAAHLVMDLGNLTSLGPIGTSDYRAIQLRPVSASSGLTIF
jgi:hypothetical protein